MLSSPYRENNARGQYSGRDYNTDKAGGPIQNLDWKGATIDRAGIDKVKLHTGRFGEVAENKVMIERLEKILTSDFIPMKSENWSATGHWVLLMVLISVMVALHGIILIQRH